MIKNSSHHRKGNIFFILIKNKPNHGAVHLNEGQKGRCIITGHCVNVKMLSSISYQINFIQANEGPKKEQGSSFRRRGSSKCTRVSKSLFSFFSTL